MKGFPTLLAIFGLTAGYVNAAVIQGSNPVAARELATKSTIGRRNETHLFDENDYTPATQVQIEDWLAKK